MNKVDLAKRLIMKNEGERAVKMLAEAAEDDPQVYDELAACYAEGLGVKADARRAKLYRKLSRQGQKAVRARRIRDARIYNQLKEVGWFGSTEHFAKSRWLVFQFEHYQMRRSQHMVNRIKAHSAKVYGTFGLNKAERAAARLWYAIGKPAHGGASYFDRLVACL